MVLILVRISSLLHHHQHRCCSSLRSYSLTSMHHHNQPPQQLQQQQQQHKHPHRLSFVCINDVYSFDDMDNHSPTNAPRGGWSRAATLMKKLVHQKRRPPTMMTPSTNNVNSSQQCEDLKNIATAATTVLTVVNGDVLGGSSLLQSSQGAVATEIMNSIPIDLAVLGNHEFDHGDEALMQRVKESNFVWLGSNVYYPSCIGTVEQGDKEGVGCDDKTNYNNDSCHQVRIEDSNNSHNVTSQDDDASDANRHHRNLHYFPGIQGNGKIYTLAGKNIKIGIFGLVTKVTPLISYPSKKVVFDSDILSVARRVTRSLRARGAQVIVAVTHLSETEDRLLAMDSVAGVDLILGGHEHEPLAVMVHRKNDTQQLHEIGERRETVIHHEETTAQERNEGGVLMFKCGMNAYWVGSVDLDIMVGEDNTVTSISTSWSMEAVNSRVSEDATVSQIIKTHRRESEASALVSNFGQSLATTLHLDDIIATIGNNTSNPTMISGTTARSSNNVVPTSSTILPLDTRMSSVRRHEATGGNLIADAMLWMLQSNLGDGGNGNNIDNSLSSMPMLAMINGGFIRGDTLYQPGSVFTVRDILKELPFPHSMKVLEIEGAHLKKAILQQLKGSSKGPTGAYPHLSSNTSLCYGHRSNTTSSSSTELDDCDEQFYIHSFMVNGKKVNDDQKYLIAVTTFVADGNEGCSAWLHGKRFGDDESAWTGVNMSCVLLKYLQCHKEIHPILQGRVVLQR